MEVSDLLPHLGQLEFLSRIRDLSIAYAFAFLIGWNRERHDHSAGIRTFPLVAVAACGFIQAAEGLAADNPEALARVIEGVITGMGFIGGGAILKSGSEVHGTATAASLWATGAIGVAVALRADDVALLITGFTIVTLYVLSRMKSEAGK